ncbi:MAG: tyrosine-type recombinase/integrase [Burkholderiaceae bacterium]|nr:tyrosine-type recombinase/integrase [Burkholderiaceae bacterium]
MPNHTIVVAQLIKLLDKLDGAYAPNTLRAYRADMQEFIRFCANKPFEALPAQPETVATFLLDTLNRGIKSSTVKRKVSSISAVHRLLSLPDPTKHPEVRITQRKIYRQLGTRFGQAFPVTRPILEKMLSVCGPDLHGLRDRALLLTAYESMRRRSELVALRIEDIEWGADNSAFILLRRSKTDQAGQGKWIQLSASAGQALEAWLAAANLEVGFIFRGVRANDQVTQSLCESRVSRIYKSLAEKANVDPKVVQQISGHSMRVGGAQDQLVEGASLPQIMVKGGWSKPDTVMRYVERVRPTNEGQRLPGSA